jgi:hypothetical protein
MTANAPSQPPVDGDPSVTLQWAPQPGSRASCQLGRRIGAGGCAEVFEAELQRPHQAAIRVALKRLLPGLRGDPLRQRQLRREAQIAAYLNHPNIVKVLSLLDLGDEVALAMELVEGLQVNQLLHRLRPRRLRLSAVAHITSGLFQALKYLENPLGQNRPLVHADISLENLMLTVDGAVKLIDFGLAAEDRRATGSLNPADSADGSANDSADSSQRDEEALTGLHQAAGKPPYLPPEGRPQRGPSAQSDLYAAGICFWELCCGLRFPLLPRGVGDREMGSLIAFAAASLPEPAWRLLRSCLAIDPSRRMRTADEGLLLCQKLRGDGNPEPELGQLLRALLQPAAALPTAGPCEPYDFVPTLVGRLDRAFGPYHVAVLLPLHDDPSELRGPSSAAAAFRVRSTAGSGPPPTAADLPTPAQLGDALDSGFVVAPDGGLLARLRPPGEPAQAVWLHPGPGCAYDELAQTLLRNLLR